MGITGIEILGWSREEAKRQVTDGVRKALKRIFQKSEMEGITTDAAACRIAEDHLTAAA
jgi:glutamate dehydrogenase/leucine dehydrogenase